MKKLMFLTLAAVLAACDVPVDLGPIRERYTCKVITSCDGVVETSFVKRCAPHGHQLQLIAENHEACEAALTARGCMKIGCDGYCEGDGVTEGDGVLRLCTGDEGFVDAGIQ